MQRHYPHSIAVVISLLTLVPQMAHADDLSELIEKAEYYLEHSTCDDKETFSAAVEAAIDADSDSETAADELKAAMQDYLLLAEPADGIAFDVTFLMSDPEMNGSAEGWSVTPTLNYNEAEFWNQTFDLYQTLTDMRAGLYRLNVTGFYRNGSYYSGIESAANAGCGIYGNEVELPLLTLYYDSSAATFRNNTGGYANTMSDAQTIFNQGYYTGNAVMFEQDETGMMTVGIRNTNSTYSNWTCFREFTLEYLGKDTVGTLLGAYRITAANYRTSGSVAPGSEVDESTPLFHTSSQPANRAGYWYLYEVNRKEYALQNAETSEFITWDGARADDSYTRRYVDVTTELKEDSSLWTLNVVSDNNLTIRSVAVPNHLFDLRVSSNVVGTYDNSGTAANNQVFNVFNALGEAVTEFSSMHFNKGVETLAVGGRELIYDKSNAVYYCVITEDELTANTYTAAVDFTLATDYTDLLINGTTVETGADYTFTDILNGNDIPMQVATSYGDQYDATLRFTSMPIVQIYGSFGDEYTTATIRVTDPDSIGADTLIQSRIRWRGATTRYRNKKQYAVKLYDESGESTDVSFFGLRDDNNWILDGLVIDKARMRNRVVTDLWNDFATKPYHYESEPEALTGTRGRFVELMLNDQYAGIYCMTEKIDRKQMKLKKYDEDAATIRGELYKASEWSYSVFMGHNYNSNTYPGTSPSSYDNESEEWDGYEVKYPDLGDGQPISWADLYNAVDFVCTATDDEFTAEVGDYFDLPVMVDYYVLMEVILSADNHGKNMYWGVYNRKKSQKLTPALWDLDSTCGRRWDASEISAAQDYTTYITDNEHGDFNLFKRLKDCNVDNFNESVRYRYKELRDGVLDTDSLLARFYAYKEMFDLNGASQREEDRWTNMDIGEIDFDDEMDYLTTWFNTRMDYLDEAFDIASIPDEEEDNADGVATITAESGVKIYVEAGSIVVDTPTSIAVSIFTIDGKQILSRQVEAGKNRLGSFPRGIYIVNKKKVAVK